MQKQVYTCKTQDGWNLALTRATRVQGEELRHPTPVVLCHGLACNRYSFDLHPSVSLAEYLALQGRDVWLLELRGHGLSERPGFKAWLKLGKGKHYSWSLKEFWDLDIPAALATICDHSGSKQVDWIGHSLGGILLYGGALRPWGSKIRKGITLGSSLDYSECGSEFEKLIPLYPYLSPWLPAVPFGWVSRLASPFAGRWKTRWEAFEYQPSNVVPTIARLHWAKTLQSVPLPVLADLMRAFEKGGMPHFEEECRLSSKLSSVLFPVLAVAGSADLQCPPEASHRTWQALGGQENEFWIASRDSGLSADYGHFDLLIGKKAKEEIYPRLCTWLS